MVTSPSFSQSHWGPSPGTPQQNKDSSAPSPFAHSETHWNWCLGHRKAGLPTLLAESQIQMKQLASEQHRRGWDPWVPATGIISYNLYPFSVAQAAASLLPATSPLWRWEEHLMHRLWPGVNFNSKTGWPAETQPPPEHASHPLPPSGQDYNDTKPKKKGGGGMRWVGAILYLWLDYEELWHTPLPVICQCEGSGPPLHKRLTDLFLLPVAWA